MRFHRKPRKLLRTAFTVLTGLFIAGYLATGWFSTCLGGLPFVTFERGDLRISTGTRPPRNYHFHFRPFADRLPPPFKLDLGLPRQGTVIDSWYAIYPLWPLVAGLIATNAIWYWRDWRNRLRPGFCRTCGYDLRATPNRCPECGHQPSPANP